MTTKVFHCIYWDEKKHCWKALFSSTDINACRDFNETHACEGIASEATLRRLNHSTRKVLTEH